MAEVGCGFAEVVERVVEEEEGGGGGDAMVVGRGDVPM